MTVSDRAERVGNAGGRSLKWNELVEVGEVSGDFWIFRIIGSRLIDGVHSRLLSSVCVR